MLKLRDLRFAAVLIPLALAGCPKNEPPVADAGPDQTVTEGAVVKLKGKGKDKDGKIVLYNWRQTSGPEVEFEASKDGSHITFVAPDVRAQTHLEFELTVYDNFAGQSIADLVKVTVNQIKFFGTAPGGPEDYEHLLTYFNQLTPENAGKWGSVEGTRDVMNWTDLDTAYQFALDNGIPFKFHTLLWGQQQPGWISGLTPEEQLAEIDEWMAAVAARYPDLELVEVLNEPLNAPPVYIDALGGTGETGYDWVITAFEMARAHFPNAELILNEYNTVMLEQFTTNYMVVIGLLKERNLIDGIGEQAHFLERADVPVVAANLDTLASAGLPIYISELDLNFADDARQANAMRDLFPVFWEHPMVAGVTHWGHLQGSVWRTDSYLVRADDTTRPALDWLLCYMGGGGDSCTVPEYVPAGWQGDEYGVTMEAELYDEGEGVAALGSVVAYTDGGDWIAFEGVEFDAGWNTFWVTYAKGNDTAGNITVHLDSLASDPVLSIDLAPTGSWGSSATLEEAWASLTGTRDVYIRFNGTEGIANIDSVRFGKPLPEPTGDNLLADGGFELSIAGWSAWNGSTLSASTAQARSGSQSLLATARPNDAQFAVYNLTALVQPGTTYAVSAWALHTGAANTTVRMAAKVECTAATAPAGHNTYPWLQNNGAVVPGVWTQLSANLIIPACDVVDVALFFEGTPAGIDVYLDDVEVIPPSSNLVSNSGFEFGTAGWAAWNGSTLSASSAQARSGAQSLLATARPNDAQFAVYSLNGLVEPGTTYAVSAWALHTAAANTTVRLAAKVECTAATAPAGHNTYPWLQNNTAVVPGVWTPLSANLVIPACDLVDVAIFFEGTPAGIDVYLDDVSVTGP